jgi:hypothetical protein
LPLVFAFIFFVFCVIVAFDAVPTNISLLFFPGFILCKKNPGLNNIKPKPIASENKDKPHFGLNPNLNSNVRVFIIKQ